MILLLFRAETVEETTPDSGGTSQRIRHLERIRKDDEEVIKLIIQIFKEISK